MIVKWFRRIQKSFSRNSSEDQMDQMSSDTIRPWTSIRLGNPAKCARGEREMAKSFQGEFNRRWPKDIHKTSFNYLLLDSGRTHGLPNRAHFTDLNEQMDTFIESIIYVGSGKGSQPYELLCQAAREKTTTGIVGKINEIWERNNGIIILQFFHSQIEAEARTREAALIAAINSIEHPRHQLVNQKSGIFYGAARIWDKAEQIELGVYLLYKALKIFIVEGERPIKWTDVKEK